MLDRMQRVSNAEQFPTLPENMQRGDVVNLLFATFHLTGMSMQTLHCLVQMINQTRPSDWTSPNSEPVCFAFQTNIAILCKKTERRIYDFETELEREHKYLEKRTGPNNQRGRYRKPDGTECNLGLVFSPLILKIPELIELSRTAEAARSQRIEAKIGLSIAKQEIKRSMEQMPPKISNSLSVEQFIASYADMPRRYDASKSNAELLDDLEAVNVLRGELSALQKDLQHNSSPTMGRRKKMADLPAENCRRPIQDTNQDIRNLSGDKEIEGQPRRARHTPTSPMKQRQCLEGRIRNDEGKPETKPDHIFSPNELLALCSQDMREAVLFYQATAPLPRVDNFVAAARDRAYFLGIAGRTYDHAILQMGRFATTLSILVIDRNMNHPITPIRSPGGVLTGMTKRHAHGQLFLQKSLMALRNRKD